MTRNTLVWLLMLAAPLIAHKQDGQRKPPATASPPEVKKTVEAITGSWSGQMTAHVPGAPVESFDWTMNCKAIALGSGASCTNTGKASIGVMAESCLLAYDPEGKAVHYMCVTSIGEVHDHKGKWTDDQTLDGSPVSLMIYVDDVDTVFNRAVAAGATVKEAVQDKFYGDRMGTLTDPFGHVWHVATHKEDVSAEEMERRAKVAGAAASGGGE